MKTNRLFNKVTVAFGYAVHEGQVFLVDFAMLELHGQFAMGDFVFDNDE